MSKEQALLAAVGEASQRWKQGFNSQNAKVCAQQYEVTATMHARPFGEFTGREQIEAFWQGLMEQGFDDVDYIEPQLEVLDDKTVQLRSQWQMNKAYGVIHKELWIMQADGCARLSHDDFEVLGEREVNTKAD
ncbi:isochorismatase [uncultured Shewanella sp.]|uniref:isochorismatase n=1 Tax=uncultured Shewanella sp. TaxID=173975 RepID=UPI00262A58F5|nr:isochorismatase [uncultured Shewanella sp.]